MAVATWQQAISATKKRKCPASKLSDRQPKKRKHERTTAKTVENHREQAKNAEMIEVFLLLLICPFSGHIAVAI